MSDLSDESTILIVDSLPLRNFGLVALLDRLSGTTKFRLASLTPDDAERWIDEDANCSMIIYNVGGASVADRKHQKRIKGLRERAAEAPLVILSDNDSREEILSALSVGAQGYLYAGTNAQHRQISISRKDKNRYSNVSAEETRTRPLRACWESERERSKSTFDRSCASWAWSTVRRSPLRARAAPGLTCAQAIVASRQD